MAESLDLELRAALMVKDDLLALISMAKTGVGGRVVTVDPRQPHPQQREYKPGEVIANFNQVRRLSRERGWMEAYVGPPLLG